MKTIQSFAFAATLIAATSMFVRVPEAQAEPKPQLSSAQIQDVMSRHAASVRDCYIKHATAQEGSRGKVTLEFLVRPSGMVSSVEVDAPAVKGQQFERCVTKLAGAWQFPESGSSTLVQYPFLFIYTKAAGAGPMVPARKQRVASAQ